MIDPWNPTLAEIRDWAFDGDADPPMTDFDLALAWAQHERVYFDLATDDTCPKRVFFLSLLYFMVGNAVRTDFRDRPQRLIDAFINVGNDFPHPDIQAWQQRSRKLLACPESFDYDDWCGGRLARK